MSLGNRIKNGWDAFMGRDPTRQYVDYGVGSSRRPDRVYINYTNARSVVSSVFNRIAVDCSMVNINHVRLDNDNRYFQSIIHDSLNTALNFRANIDQTGRALVKDAAFSLLDTGSIAIVPTLTTIDPIVSEAYEIIELRVAKILEWYPYAVRVDIYNDHTGQHVEKVFDKSYVAIVENPFYQIMNEPNASLQRFKRITQQVEQANQNFGNDRFNMIVQLPYAINNEQKKTLQKRRIKDLEDQLENSKYGIGWIDATEHVIQLNRSLENNLWTQARDLQEDLFNELGFTQSILDGTADEKTILNYNNRTIEPILSAITEAMECKWLSKTAISQHQGIRFYKDPFRLVPVEQIAEIADKFTRNEILSANEVRSILGFLPSNDPKADELRNSNLNHPDEKQEVVKTEVANVESIIKEVENSK